MAMIPMEHDNVGTATFTVDTSTLASSATVECFKDGHFIGFKITGATARAFSTDGSYVLGSLSVIPASAVHYPAITIESPYNYIGDVLVSTTGAVTLKSSTSLASGKRISVCGVYWA